MGRLTCFVFVWRIQSRGRAKWLAAMGFSFGRGG